MQKRNENLGQPPERDTKKSIERQLSNDEPSDASLKHVVEPGGCEKKDSMNMGAVVTEFQLLITGLTTIGLIKIQEDTVLITEKGRKVLECLKKQKGIERRLKRQR